MSFAEQPRESIHIFGEVWTPVQLEGKIHLIQPSGDLILQLNDESGHTFECKVSSKVLCNKSTYFRALLDPARGFTEAVKPESIESSPPRRLPIPIPSDEALTSQKAQWDRMVVRLLEIFQILHDKESSIPVFFADADDLFFVALCWDQFVITHRLSIEVLNRELFDMRGKRKKNCLRKRAMWLPKPAIADQELHCRKLLFAVYKLTLLDQVEQYTRWLILLGSRTHREWFVEEVEEKDTRLDSPLWHLPGGLEEEIFLRRRTILRCISKDIDLVVEQYVTSAQCRFGYGNSPACDIFQLGQVLRFLKRKNLASLESQIRLAGDDTLQPMYDGSLLELVALLRSMPSDQVDQHHQHCGARKQLLPLLQRIEEILSKENAVGICGNCWEEDRGHHSWSANARHRPGLPQNSVCKVKHIHQIAHSHFQSSVVKLV